MDDFKCVICLLSWDPHDIKYKLVKLQDYSLSSEPVVIELCIDPQSSSLYLVFSEEGKIITLSVLISAEYLSLSIKIPECVIERLDIGPSISLVDAFLQQGCLHFVCESSTAPQDKLIVYRRGDTTPCEFLCDKYCSSGELGIVFQKDKKLHLKYDHTFNNESDFVVSCGEEDPLNVIPIFFLSNGFQQSCFIIQQNTRSFVLSRHNMTEIDLKTRICHLFPLSKTHFITVSDHNFRIFQLTFGTSDDEIPKEKEILDPIMSVDMTLSSRKVSLFMKIYKKCEGLIDVMNSWKSDLIFRNKITKQLPLKYLRTFDKYIVPIRDCYDSAKTLLESGGKDRKVKLVCTMMKCLEDGDKDTFDEQFGKILENVSEIQKLVCDYEKHFSAFYNVINDVICPYQTLEHKILFNLLIESPKIINSLGNLLPFDEKSELGKTSEEEKIENIQTDSECFKSLVTLFDHILSDRFEKQSNSVYGENVIKEFILLLEKIVGDKLPFIEIPDSSCIIKFIQDHHDTEKYQAWLD
ncbi:hypothetical protein ADUPG1_006069, partial [Aduncisulcus paluster]